MAKKILKSLIVTELQSLATSKVIKKPDFANQLLSYLSTLTDGYSGLKVASGKNRGNLAEIITLKTSFHEYADFHP